MRVGHTFCGKKCVGTVVMILVGIYTFAMGEALC